MGVEQLMTRDPWTVTPDDTPGVAARSLRDNDIGVLVVVDPARAGRAVGTITDRDVCMAAFTQGRSLGDLRVAAAMSRAVIVCRPDEPVTEATRRMREHQVRRLPVVDEGGRPVGVLSLNDLAREAVRFCGEVAPYEVVETLAGASQPRRAAAGPRRSRNGVSSRACPPAAPSPAIASAG